MDMTEAEMMSNIGDGPRLGDLLELTGAALVPDPPGANLDALRAAPGTPVCAWSV